MADMIETVESLTHGRAVDEECGRQSRDMDVLVQVNTSGEDQKSGVRPEGLLALLKELSLLRRLRIRGLMTLAMLTEDKARVRGCFRCLNGLRQDAEKEGFPLIHLSMGMSGDFEEAVEEGATLIRIGTALFGERV
jgi:pyridoxal phosphate enzyme (YggS family)